MLSFTKIEEILSECVLKESAISFVNIKIEMFISRVS